MGENQEEAIIIGQSQLDNQAMMYKETQDVTNASQTEHSASLRLITPVFFRGAS